MEKGGTGMSGTCFHLWWEEGWIWALLWLARNCRASQALASPLSAQRRPEARVRGKNHPTLPLRPPCSRLLIFYLKYL